MKSEDIANCLNTVFFKAFSNPQVLDPPVFEKRTNANHFFNYNQIFNLVKIKKLLGELDHRKSVGLDNVHPRVLKECCESLCLPLMLLFKKSYLEGSLPSVWKRANVTPIHKKGVKTDPNNFRPISLTSKVCKVMERLTRDDMMEHLLSNELISKDQHGFTFNKSCSTNLLESLDLITESLNRGFHSVVV